MFEHLRMKRLVSLFIDRELSEEENQSFLDHLGKCKRCQKEVLRLKSLGRVLEKWSDEDVSPDMEQKIRKSSVGDRYKGAVVMKKKDKLILTGSSVVLAILVMAVGAKFMVERAGIDVVVKTEAVNEKKDKRIEGKRFELAEPVIRNQFVSTERESSPRDVLFSGKVKRAEREKAVPWEEMKRSHQPSFVRDWNSSRLADSADFKVRPGYVLSGGGYILSEGLNISFSSPNITETSREAYDRIYENRFFDPKETPVSTFSIDVDTASYSNLRRYIKSGVRPPKDAVRIEEMINYFSYDYAQPKGDDPFSITMELGSCPWNKGHQLALIGIQGKKIETNNLPPSNLVFLIDVSGSMNDYNKLPLLKSGFKLLVNQLRPEDKVSIVVYAGAAGVVLESTAGSAKQAILEAIDRLNAGGSTAGGAGISLAYKIAEENFVSGGNNRVVLATDGDFNVGASSNAEMIRLIEEKRQNNIFLTVLGLGTGNLQDSKMEQIADKGNGSYYYVDSLMEAKKVLVNELGATLFTIAKDLKIQIEFNPAQVKAYRLIGYENRILNKEDFNDDAKDAGELGAGSAVTALYEIVPIGSDDQVLTVDPLKYQKKTLNQSSEIMNVKLRYKKPDENKSILLERGVSESDLGKTVTDNFNFASSVAEFGLLLRDSEYKAQASFDNLKKRARASKSSDYFGYRAEFISLVEEFELLNPVKE
ncbi:MAG: von Willebrand factor type A domain-containing protein [Candidatus Omnitrophica bacterium]|nr:von Willebrand factor type A domain-containing protein [Candidatus Omnitrophota bacterium]